MININSVEEFKKIRKEGMSIKTIKNIHNENLEGEIRNVTKVLDNGIIIGNRLLKDSSNFIFDGNKIKVVVNGNNTTKLYIDKLDGKKDEMVYIIEKQLKEFKNRGIEFIDDYTFIGYEYEILQ